MLESMVIIVTAIGLLFTILMLLSNREQPAFGILACIVWFIAAASIISVDVPYSHLYDNSTADNYEVVSGTNATTTASTLRFLFIGFAFICLGYTFIMLVAMLAEIWKEKKKKAKR